MRDGCGVQSSLMGSSLNKDDVHSYPMDSQGMVMKYDCLDHDRVTTDLTSVE